MTQVQDGKVVDGTAEVPMTYEQELHLSNIVVGFAREVDAKYRKGQKEHGGNLWMKSGMLQFLREETLDFIVYSATLEQQLDRLHVYLQTCVERGDQWASPALAMVDAILSTGPEDETGGTNAGAK